MSRMSDSVKALVGIGVPSVVHRFDRGVAIAMLERKLEALRADEGSVLCVRPGLVDRGTKNERVALWFYTSTTGSARTVNGPEGDDDGEDTSWPCPPFYPPSGPPCP
jgi:hypothetical protein